MKKGSVLLILTGGTISMGKKANNSLAPLNCDEVLASIPEIQNMNVNISSIAFSPLIDSSDMALENWVTICEIIEENYDKYDGFVVLHGTDTMSFSASAVSFMLENLSKPVIFTGSQLPVGVHRSDAKENLITSIEIAAARDDKGNAIVQEVCVFFEDQLMRGNRTTKRNAEEFDAFASFNYHNLAKSGVHIRFYPEYFWASGSKKPLKVHKHLDNNIAILRIFPGINEQTVAAVLRTEGLKAVVLETYGTGNAPSAKWLYKLLCEATKAGIIILNITQCRAGSVEMGRYATSLNLKKAGVVSGYDMTVEAAVAKLMFLFGKYDDNEKIKKELNTSLRGEVTIN
ncbi:MAG: type I asparaginase [Porphyromonadaceae bacterium]|nr:type I asparaginase [Porphyromonadaceae bacterium]